MGMNTLVSAVLAKPAVERVRRNHGLEHATIHLIGADVRRGGLTGRSDHRGFTLYGDVPTEVLADACERALQRLRSGEPGLAIHPYCGTNFVTAGLLASLVAVLTLFGTGRSWRTRLARFPLLISLVTGALILSQPLGIAIQRNVTTSADLGDMEIVSIKRRRIGGFTFHRIDTR